uniref:non-specific serine/threonine protein kinase n=1 Tax=Globodera rostochiensis TaxID=31243 RepID=A0A914HKS3_GLORO
MRILSKTFDGETTTAQFPLPFDSALMNASAIENNPANRKVHGTITSSFPIKVRSCAKKLDNDLPMKGLPSSTSALKMFTGFTKRPLNNKLGGAVSALPSRQQLKQLAEDNEANTVRNGGDGISAGDNVPPSPCLSNISEQYTFASTPSAEFVPHQTTNHSSLQRMMTGDQRHLAGPLSSSLNTTQMMSSSNSSTSSASSCYSNLFTEICAQTAQCQPLPTIDINPENEALKQFNGLLKDANKLSPLSYNMIVSFLSGNKTNPLMDKLGTLITLPLSESVELEANDTSGTSAAAVFLVETFFQMNYCTGEWKRLRKSRLLKPEELGKYAHYLHGTKQLINNNHFGTASSNDCGGAMLNALSTPGGTDALVPNFAGQHVVQHQQGQQQHMVPRRQQQQQTFWALQQQQHQQPFGHMANKTKKKRSGVKDATKFKEKGIKFNTEKGQHILKNPGVVHAIVEKSAVKGTDTVLEPALLPFDNPSNFTFFFDTDRRRHCYLAPERFRDSEELEARASAVAGDFPNFYECLTEAMDIFAMGCLLVELLSDGRQIAFNLPQAIDYKNADEHTAKFFLKRLLSAVPDTEFRPLIAIMLDRDPKRRRDEFLKLSPCSSTVLFPQIFERYLYNYFKELQSIQSADALITKLFVERDNYMALLRDEDAANFVLFINIICAALRSCCSLTAKMDALSLLHQISKISTPVIIFERIVPYLAHSISDHFPLVRAEAILILCDILSTCANSIPPDECRLLIARWTQMMAEQKRRNKEARERRKAAAKLALKCLFDFSSIVLKLLKQSSSIDAVTEFFVTFCGCTDNEVRRCLFQPTNLDLLCQFFGASRVTDVLMHMITLLNDKHDWRVRAAFFEACPVLAQHLGQNRNSKLMPFLQQGLQDCEEFVVLECVCCVHALCRRQLLPKATICELLPDLVPLLVHPNKWLRIALVNILTILETDSCFTIADIYCKLTPLVTTFLRHPLIRLDCRDVLYETLVQPISRQIWDFICEQNNSAELITLIEERKTLEKLGGATKGNSGSNNSLLFNVISNVATMHHFDEKLNVADSKLPKTMGQLSKAQTLCSRPQNVLVSSSLWIQLTDFAPFKPALLPFDNPSDFTFFFDTDRRRHCYLAPERFRDSEELEARASAVAGDFPNFYECLTEAMDIFAMGCLLVELLSDGRQIAFNLPQAIDYKNADEHTAKFFLKRLLSAVPDTEFRPLIAIMYLYNYFKELQSIQSADALITKLFVERDNYMALLRDEDAANSVLFINIICAALRSCCSLTAKMDALSLLHQISKISTPVIIFERIVPYLAHSISDHFPLVRAEAILILCDILSTCANSIPPDECRLLIDFVFPKLCPIVISSACLPRIALATNLGKLAQISARFFEASVARMRSESPEQNQPEHGGGGCSTTTVQQMSSRLEKFLCEEKRLLLETERSSSIDAVTEFFVTFCGCTDNEVRRCLFQPTNLDLLCQFFGASRVTDVLMHMITLLNDKHDWRVRAAFFEACPVLAQHLGQNRNSKLMPFLQQGLQDCEEFVVLECVCCVHALCRRQLLPKATICELLPDLVPLLVHPNKGRNAIELSSVWQRRIKNSYGLITSFCIDTINQHWMLLTASSATTKNMLLWDLRFAGLEVCSWSHPSDRIIPLRSWALPNGSRCDRALTNCSREAELSIWDLSTRSRTDVLWPSTEAPLTYKTEMVSTAVAPSMIDGSHIIFTGDSEGSLRCWNLRYPNASAYLCGPYRRHLPSGDLNIGDLQQLKSPSRIVYRQMQITDSVLRVQAEDRSQLISPEAENGT